MITNYQSELPDLFHIGEDLVSYTSLEELHDLTAYYLEHDTERQEIAYNGFQKVKENYTYPIRLQQMLQLAFQIF